MLVQKTNCSCFRILKPFICHCRLSVFKHHHAHSREQEDAIFYRAESRCYRFLFLPALLLPFLARVVVFTRHAGRDRQQVERPSEFVKEVSSSIQPMPAHAKVTTAQTSMCLMRVLVRAESSHAPTHVQAHAMMKF